MKTASDTGYQIAARQLMESILFDNGAVNSNEPDNLSRYPKKHFEAITAGCETFFEAHPDLLTDADLENIACGEQSENDALYRVHPEFKALDDALEAYFNII